MRVGDTLSALRLERLRDLPTDRHLRFAGIGLAAVALLLAPFFWAEAERVGYHIPGWAAQEDYLWGVGWAILLGAAILLWPLPRRERAALGVAWGAKVLVALGFMLYYESHYDALDAFGYYIRGLDTPLSWPSLDIGRGTKSIDMLVHLVGLVVPDSYHTLKVSFAYIGLIAVYLFYRAAAIVTGRREIWMLLGLALFPSILMWSSILGKDPIVLFALSLVAWGLASAWAGRRAGLIAVAVGLVLGTIIRPWILPLVLFPTVVVGMWRLLRRRPRAQQVGGVVALLVLFVLGAYGALQYLNVHSVDGLLARLNAQSRAWAYGGSGQAPPEFDTVWAVLAFLPWGAFTALFRPFPGEITSSAFGILASLESVPVLAAVLLAVVRAKRSLLRSPPFVWTLLFVAGWACFYAFLSYQNMGSAVRFRLQVLPFGLFLVLDALLHAEARPAASPAPVARLDEA